MFKTSILLFSVLLLGCSDPGMKDVHLEAGAAVILIDDDTYGAEAIMDTTTLGETLYEEISIIVSDTVSLSILSEAFQEDLIMWTGETFSVEHTMVFLKDPHRGGGFMGPQNGYLLVKDRTDSNISGKFEWTLYDFTSCCIDCPGNEVVVQGQFSALIK